MENTTKLPELAKAIAGHMDGWTAHSEDDGWGGVRAELRHADGRVLHLRAGSRYGGTPEGKLHVSGGWPKDPDGTYRIPYVSSFNAETATGVHVARNGINLSMEKSPAVIAKEITRRYLPAYTAAWAEMKGASDKAHEHTTETETTAAAVASLLGGRLSTNERAGAWTRTVWSSGRIREAKVTGGRVELELRDLTVSEVSAIMGVLNKEVV